MTPWTVAHRLLCPGGFSRQAHCSELPFPYEGDRPDPGIQPWSPILQGDSLLSEPLEAGVKIKFEIVINQPVVSILLRLTVLPVCLLIIFNVVKKTRTLTNVLITL